MDKNNKIEISLLRQKYGELEKKCKELEEKHKEMKEKHKEMEEKHKEMEEKNKEMKEKHKEMEKKHKEMEEKHKEVQEKCKEMEKIHQDISSSMQSIFPEIKKNIGKLQNQQTSKYKDINNKLSEYVQNIIQDSKGPLKPEQLERFLIDDVFSRQRKKVLNVIKKYSSDTPRVRNQLLEICQNVETHMEYRKKQAKLDSNFIKTMKKLEKKIGEEQSNEAQKNLKPNGKVKAPPIKKQVIMSKKSNNLEVVKKQINEESKKVKQQTIETIKNKGTVKNNVIFNKENVKNNVIFNKETVRNKGIVNKETVINNVIFNKETAKNKGTVNKETVKNKGIVNKETVNNSRKRKYEFDTDSGSSQEADISDNSQESGIADSCNSQESEFADSCSSQGTVVRQLTTRLSKRLKIDSSEETDSLSDDDRPIDVAHSKGKKKKISKTSDSGFEKDGSNCSENELTILENPFSV